MAHNSTLKVRARIIDLHEEERSEFDKKLAIYKYGEDNLYPERIERIIHNSPTAKAATDLFKEYILGEGIPGFNEAKVNPNQTGWDLLCDIAESYVIHKGFAIHVGYNAEFKIPELKVLPFRSARKGKKDDKDWTSKIVISDDWKKAKAKEVELVDTFNPIGNVVMAQLEKAKKDGKKYKGQIFYFNPENATYPLAWIDPAYNDADSEYRAGLYKNTLLRKGFFGKTLIGTPPLMQEITQVEQEGLEQGALAEYRKQLSEADEVRETIESFLGAENVDGVLHLEMDPGDERKMEDVLMVKNIESNIDDKLFEFTEKSVANNIRKSIKRIPGILIERNESSLFGDSGKLLIEAKKQFQETTEPDRRNIVNALKKVFDHCTDNLKVFAGREISPLIKVEQEPQPAEE